MKLLFICGASVQDGALKCPSWVRGMLAFLGDEKVTILSSEFSGSESLTLTVDDSSVGLYPKQLWDDAERFSAVVKREQADVIVIFGTESAYTLSALKLCAAADILDRTALFAQGLACACFQHYAEGVPERVVRRWTFRDLLRRENIRAEQKRMQARSDAEKQAIALARHFIGRTTMDRAVSALIHPQIAYYRCNDLLRTAFYEGQWRYDRCEKRRIFISQYYYPLKGFHYLLEAASLLIKKYPDLRIAAAGYNPILGSVAKNELKDSSYIRYLKALIRRYDLQEHIELLGVLDEERMKAEYLRANAFVLPSTIENSPNSLGEAMMLGVPCITSDVGGVSDFATHREDAYVYPSSATYLLAYYLDKVFSDPEEAVRLGENARKRAASDFDREKNIEALRGAFNQIAKKS